MCIISFEVWLTQLSISINISDITSFSHSTLFIKPRLSCLPAAYSYVTNVLRLKFLPRKEDTYAGISVQKINKMRYVRNKTKFKKIPKIFLFIYENFRRVKTWLKNFTTTENLSFSVFLVFYVYFCMDYFLNTGHRILNVRKINRALNNYCNTLK